MMVDGMDNEPNDPAEEIDECIICMDFFKPGKDKFVQNDDSQYKLCCSHDMFHEKCLFEWLEKTPLCPLCK